MLKQRGIYFQEHYQNGQKWGGVVVFFSILTTTDQCFTYAEIIDFFDVTRCWGGDT